MPFQGDDCLSSLWCSGPQQSWCILLPMHWWVRQTINKQREVKGFHLISAVPTTPHNSSLLAFTWSMRAHITYGHRFGRVERTEYFGQRPCLNVKIYLGLRSKILKGYATCNANQGSQRSESILFCLPLNDPKAPKYLRLAGGVSLAPVASNISRSAFKWPVSLIVSANEVLQIAFSWRKRFPRKWKTKANAGHSNELNGLR